MTAGAEPRDPSAPDGWTPQPPSYPPVFVWPPRVGALLRWLPTWVLSFNAVYLVIAGLVWWLATPSIETMTSLRPGWLAALLIRNLVLVSVGSGLAHHRLYRRRAQGARFKFNPSWPAPSRRSRTLGSQTRENVIWTLVSGVPIWTAWEASLLWLYANGRIPWVAWSDSPLWFLAAFALIPLYRELHFYAVHRLIHWPPLYRSVHRLHHRNVNPSPWSGLSMHPVEHLLYFSALAVHLVVPTHPLHATYTSIHLALAPIPGHAGFERFEVGTAQIASGGFAHYLHHRLFEVNYADGVIPLDRWFGSFHDGSPEADRRLAARRRARTSAADRSAS